MTLEELIEGQSLVVHTLQEVENRILGLEVGFLLRWL
jgi:hypothetical protein